MRNLKVLDRVFYRPLVDSGGQLMSRELLDRLFPNLEEVLAWHNKYNVKMKERVKKEGFPIGKVGDLLGEMVRINWRDIVLMF